MSCPAKSKFHSMLQSLYANLVHVNHRHFLLANASFAEKIAPHSRPLLRPGVYSGSGRTLAYQEYSAPIWSNPERVWFVDFKNVFGNHGDSEQNIGVAYRFLDARQTSIWGFNFFHFFHDTRNFALNSNTTLWGSGYQRFPDSAAAAPLSSMRPEEPA